MLNYAATSIQLIFETIILETSYKMKAIRLIFLFNMFSALFGLTRADEPAAKSFEDLAGRIHIFVVQRFLMNVGYWINCNNGGSPNPRAEKSFARAKALTSNASSDELTSLLTNPDPMVRTLAMAKLFDKQHFKQPPFGAELPGVPCQEEVDFRALADSTSEDQLRQLRQHPDPKVRTLALAALFQKDNPHVLPDIMSLANDSAKTFSAPGPQAQQVVPGAPTLPPQDQTVGEVAKTMIGCYLDPWDIGSTLTSPEAFAAYWEKRKDRTYCAGWFQVQAWRASSPASETGWFEKEPGIRRVRRRIDALPTDDRAWTLLTISRGFSTVLVNEAELVQILKELGPDILLAALQGHIQTDDPDLLQLRPAAKEFLLQHAADFFRPEDGDLILKQGTLEVAGNQLISPWWWIAAAQLQPQKADAILHEGYDALKKTGTDESQFVPLSITLWKTMGERETDFLTDWFYIPAPAKTPWAMENARVDFIRELTKSDSPLTRNFLAHLLLDARASTLQPETMAVIVDAVDGWITMPVVTPAEHDQLISHKGGPKPEGVPGLVERLRVSIPQWNS